MADRQNVLMFRPPETPGMPDVGPSGAILDTARVVQRDNGEFLLVTTGARKLRGKKAAGYVCWNRR